MLNWVHNQIIMHHKLVNRRHNWDWCTSVAKNSSYRIFFHYKSWFHFFQPSYWCALMGTQRLRWRHNERDCVSNHQPRHYLLNRLFGCKSKKTSKLRVTGLCAENSPGTGEFPAQMASNAENVSIWWRHHGDLPQHTKCLLISYMEALRTLAVFYVTVIHKGLETCGCVISTVVTAALVLKHQAISIHSADKHSLYLD